MSSPTSVSLALVRVALPIVPRRRIIGATHMCRLSVASSSNLICIAGVEADNPGGEGPRRAVAHTSASEPLAAATFHPLGVTGSPSRQGGAADSDRVGIHQPSPRGDIGGPHQLRLRRGTPMSRLSILRARHQAAGVAAPRHRAWYSLANPWAGARLGSASIASAHSFRGAEARGHGAPPRFRVRIGTGQRAARSAPPPSASHRAA